VGRLAFFVEQMAAAGAICGSIIGICYLFAIYPEVMVTLFGSAVAAMIANRLKRLCERSANIF
jgi:hypothetical protein